MKEGGVLNKVALVYGQMNEHPRLATVSWPDRHTLASLHTGYLIRAAVFFIYACTLQPFRSTGEFR